MIQAALFGIIASIAILKLKSIRPEIALALGIAASLILALYGLKEMKQILNVFETIRAYSGIPKSYFQILLKLIGISFLCEFTSDICKDSGQTTIGKQIEFIGKMSILIVSIPIFQALLETIQKLIGNGK
ncbi:MULTISPECIES: SpoIIIAC/SpoIIIAD family protein [Anaerostipes]|uniref:SpoIIIAC/SpoIIIAD family protein n=1 Tax=Anaerostipes TaxID=207244 RepID=UPI000951245F|nr:MULTISPECIES: SpoIIIAC/SpoIIIAD family protein [Anaerostipes]MCI5623270.1 stage III sporulation protein AD [Anaerostipes sp.]MDY2726553.1 SpoIIIAC/SpoIIIAD family protein [Anaerostipes faecalis]OLR58613.1 stage III sporulation protein AD [Anaerostipes sp. 494a]